MSQNVSKLKIASVLFATLLIGAVLGAASIGTFIQSRINNFQEFRTAEGFVAQMTEWVGPIPEESKAQANQILTKTGRELENVMGDTHARVGSLFDKMEADLAKILPPEQLAHWKMLRSDMQEQIRGE